MKIYVASSWRNQQQPNVVAALRAAGHEVYDFKNPRPGDNGFHWSEIDPQWKSWGTLAYREALEHTIAKAGFRSDMDALEGCDACVLVLPCGRSAHLELGWAAGAGKRTAVLMLGPEEPELMYRMLHRVCVTVEEVIDWLATPSPESDRAPSEEQLAEWERLEEQATPQPWHLTKDGESIIQTKHVTRDVWTIPHNPGDMAFIAAARTALPALIAEVRRLRAPEPRGMRGAGRQS